MPIKRSEMQKELDDLNENLESISDLADEALDPELSREELVAKVKEIADLASAEEEEEESQGE
jgi:hypothetical protein